MLGAVAHFMLVLAAPGPCLWRLINSKYLIHRLQFERNVCKFLSFLLLFLLGIPTKIDTRNQAARK